MAHKRSSTKQHATRHARRAESRAEAEQAAAETPSERMKRTALPAEERRTFGPAPALSQARPTSDHPETVRGVAAPDADWANGAESEDDETTASDPTTSIEE